METVTPDQLLDMAEEADRRGAAKLDGDTLRDLAGQLDRSRYAQAEREKQRLAVALNEARKNRLSAAGRKYLKALASDLHEHGGPWSREQAQQLEIIAGGTSS